MLEKDDQSIDEEEPSEDDHQIIDKILKEAQEKVAISKEDIKKVDTKKDDSKKDDLQSKDFLPTDFEVEVEGGDFDYVNS